uniref:Uncharacterized protein LOC111102960 isoform X2 n=1 Tax=Crassostrea virginica TaxID=6565 RepID=A0A8B8AND9_CRAVI|nr:uncharacterized protein LOC111102960 isoform X2 [Crassostrea virginica]
MCLFWVFGSIGSRNKECDKMKGLLLKTINFHMTLLLLQVNCSYNTGFCKESQETVKRVKTCPKSKSAWKEREKMKNCSSIVHSCSRDLQYHCLINAWQNMTVEVCVPSININAGYCAEYNIFGGRVQDYYTRTCSLCKYNYVSTDAYRYSECYDAVKSNIGSDQNKTSIAAITQSREIQLFSICFLYLCTVYIHFYSSKYVTIWIREKIYIIILFKLSGFFSARIIFLSSYLSYL